MDFTARFVSSLEKVFCSPELPAEEIESVSGARGETVAFQLVCRNESNSVIEIRAESEIAEFLTMREVGLVPCLMPAMPDDPFVLTSRAGVFPDPLLPLEGNRMRLTRGNWHAVWCSIRIPEDMKPGTYEIRSRCSRSVFRNRSFFPSTGSTRTACRRITAFPAGAKDTGNFWSNTSGTWCGTETT